MSQNIFFFTDLSRQRKENNAFDEMNNSKIDSFKSELKSLTFNADMEKILLECLKLPNNISVDTPIGGNSFLINRYDPQEQRRCDHSYFLIDRRLVDLRKNPDRLYMLGAAADIYYKIEELVRLSFDRFRYRLVSPSNFLRTSIAEALEVADLSEVEQIYQSIASIFGVNGQDTVWGLNLSGHCLGSYLALFVEKRLSENNQLPIIFSSIGTSYKSSKTSDSSALRWLSSHIQRPVATIFVLFSSDDQREAVENRLVSDIDKILTSFDINWKKYLAPSERLKSAEMKRLDWISVMGPVLDGVRCAQVAFYGDFLSKRLRFTYNSNKSDWTYLHLAYAEIDLYNIFGAVIERCIDESSEKVDLNLFSALVDKNFAHLLN